MKRALHRTLWTLTLLTLLAACGGGQGDSSDGSDGVSPPKDGTRAPDTLEDMGSGDGDDVEVVDAFAPLGEPVPYATPEQLEAFERGAQLVRHRFTAEEGLGPHYTVAFCGACHEKPVFGGSAGHYRDFLLVAQVLPDGSFIPRTSDRTPFTVTPRVKSAFTSCELTGPRTMRI